LRLVAKMIKNDMKLLGPVLKAQPDLARSAMLDKVLALGYAEKDPVAVRLVTEAKIWAPLPRTSRAVEGLAPVMTTVGQKVARNRSVLYSEKYGARPRIYGRVEAGFRELLAACEDARLVSLVSDVSVGVTRICEVVSARSTLRLLRREVDEELQHIGEVIFENIKRVILSGDVKIERLPSDEQEKGVQFLVNHFQELRATGDTLWPWKTVEEMRAAIGKMEVWRVFTYESLEIAALSASDGTRAWLFCDENGVTESPKSSGRLLAHEIGGHNRERLRLRESGKEPVSVARCVSPIVDRRFQVPAEWVGGGAPIESGLWVEAIAGYLCELWRSFCVQRALKVWRRRRVLLYDG
jgi:hypothetical protein